MPYALERLAGAVEALAQERMTIGHVLSDIGRLARRGTVRPEWIQSALKIVVERRNREQNHEQGQTP